MKKTATAVVFSEPEKAAIRSAASAVWNEVAYDMLTAIAEEKGKSVDAVTASRSEVIEVALDAGRAEDELRAWAKREPELLTADFFKRLDKASYAELIAVVKPAFPYARYGT